MPYNACIMRVCNFTLQKKNWNKYFNVSLEAFYIIINEVYTHEVIL